MHLYYVDDATVHSTVHSKTDPEITTNRDSGKNTEIREKHSKLFMILTLVFLATSSITTTVIVILSWKLYHNNRNRNNGR